MSVSGRAFRSPLARLIPSWDGEWPRHASREGDCVVATFTTSAELAGHPGYMHGGIASALLDEAMGALGGSDVGLVTASLEVRFHGPVPLDGREVHVVA